MWQLYELGSIVIVGLDVGSAKKMVSVNKIISHACGATFTDLCIVIFLIRHILSPEALALKKPWVGLCIQGFYVVSVGKECETRKY